MTRLFHGCIIATHYLKASAAYVIIFEVVYVCLLRLAAPEIQARFGALATSLCVFTPCLFYYSIGGISYELITVLSFSLSQNRIEEKKDRKETIGR